MYLWNFIHETFGMHMHELLAIALLAVVLISAVVHTVKGKLASKTEYAADNKKSAAQNKREGE